MKKHLIRGKIIVIYGLSLFLLISCAGAPKAPQHISPTFAEKSLVTLGITPVTYDDRYAEPLDIRLSPIILRNTEKVLQAKGYRTQIISAPAVASGDIQSDPIEMEPSQVVQDIPADIDAVVAIHIRSHFGLDLTERQPELMGPSISLNGTARLISVNNPEELWRDTGRGKSLLKGKFLRRTQFWIELNEATRSLTDNLFATLPAKTD
jgi:hypothetical protein